MQRRMRVRCAGLRPGVASSAAPVAPPSAPSPSASRVLARSTRHSRRAWPARHRGLGSHFALSPFTGVRTGASSIKWRLCRYACAALTIAVVRAGRRISRRRNRFFRHRRAQPRQRFCGLLPPIRAPKTLCGNRVPANRIVASPGLFFHCPGLERHHRVAGLLKQFVQLARGIAAGARPANTPLDLPPVCHGWRLYQWISARTSASVRCSSASAPLDSAAKPSALGAS